MGGHDLTPGLIVSPIAAALRRKDLVPPHRPAVLLVSGTVAGTANKPCKHAQQWTTSRHQHTWWRGGAGGDGGRGRGGGVVSKNMLTVWVRINRDYRTCATPSKSKSGVWGGRKQRRRLKPWRQGGTAWHQRRVRVENSAPSCARTTVDCCAGANPKDKKHVCTGVGYIHAKSTLTYRTNENHTYDNEQIKQQHRTHGCRPTHQDTH